MLYFYKLNKDSLRHFTTDFVTKPADIAKKTRSGTENGTESESERKIANNVNHLKLKIFWTQIIYCRSVVYIKRIFINTILFINTFLLISFNFFISFDSWVCSYPYITMIYEH